MEIKGKVINIVQTETRGTVQLSVVDTDKKEIAQIAISFISPFETSMFMIGEMYLVNVTPTNK